MAPLVSAALQRAVLLPVLLRSAVLCFVGLFSVSCSTDTDVVSVAGESSPAGMPPAGMPASSEPPLSPVSAPAPLPDSVGEPGVDEPEPSATETNFRNRRCTADADCGDAARCQLDSDEGGDAVATADAGAAATADAGARGSSDAGAAAPVDAAADSAEAGGRCVPQT